jgi:hypothetical protein
VARRVVGLQLLIAIPAGSHLLEVQLTLESNRRLSEHKLPSHRCNPLPFIDHYPPMVLLVLSSTRWPCFQVIHFLFIDENGTSSKTTGDNIPLYTVLKPRGHAATKEGEVRVNDFHLTVLSRNILVGIFVPDVSEEGDNGFRYMLSSYEGIKLIGECSELFVFVFLSLDCVFYTPLFRH